MRINFKKKEFEVSKFIKFCEEYGAEYYEDGGVWIIPKKWGSKLLGIKLKENGVFYFGIIEKSCNNFKQTSDLSLYSRERDWVIETLNIFKRWRK